MDEALAVNWIESQDPICAKVAKQLLTSTSTVSWEVHPSESTTLWT